MSTVISPTQTTQIRATGAELDAFHRLVRELSDVLGPTSGLDSAEVDHEVLMDLMKKYTSKWSEWQMYALVGQSIPEVPQRTVTDDFKADYTRPYTRNLVDKGNGKSNLLILVWTPGRGSPIHDHADSHCVMKILRGHLKETLYDWPDTDTVEGGVASPPVVKKETIFSEGEVTYMSDDIGLHRVENPDPETVAVSLHLYTPPHAATRGCHIFDERTGRPSHVMCPQFSEYGQRV